MRHTGSFFEEVQAILERDGRELVLMQQNAHGLILEGLLVLYNEKGNTKFSNFFVHKRKEKKTFSVVFCFVWMTATSLSQTEKVELTQFKTAFAFWKFLIGIDKLD